MGQQVYGYAPIVPVAAPYKSKATAAVLAFFLGIFGIHRFYTGQTALGVSMLLITVVGGVVTCGLAVFVTAVWALIDFILILSGAVNDQWGRPLV